MLSIQASKWQKWSAGPLSTGRNLFSWTVSTYAVRQRKMSTNCHLLLWLWRRLRIIHWVCVDIAGTHSSAGSREGGRHYQRKQSTMRAQFSTPPHMCMHTHTYTHTVKYEKGGRNWGAVKCSTCPRRRGLTVVASFQPQGFNATLISGGLDISDHSLLISCESAFPAQMSTFRGRLDSTGKKRPYISAGYWFLFSS